MIWLYNVLWAAALILGAPVWLPWVLLSSARRRGFRERWSPLPVRSQQTIWVHAASVGEAEAAMPLLARLQEQGLSLIVTTSTATGRGRLRERFPGLTVRLAPLDLPGLIQVSVRRARVQTLVLVETELWPNMMRAVSVADGRVVIVSARISDRSYRWYLRARVLFAPLLRRVDRLGARSEADLARFIALGVREERATLTGDLKLDRPPPEAASDELRNAIGRGPFLIGGSTHAGEEEALLRAWSELRKGAAPELRLLLVPRHLQRVPAVCALVERHGASFGLRSEGARQADVVIVDTLGELATLYGLAELVFSGGTLADVGGHNLIEPVQAGRVLVHGPHIENQRHQEQLLRPFGVLHRVRAPEDLARVLGELWADPERNARAAAAREGLLAHRGALELTLKLLRPAGGPRA
ncbi:MAG: 3-deoxy-D-manno-octulosonic acid transferase [Deltaproteobacteria bacterium]|nr:3-deoxy-D-manno-octulosonic acid transferase [Myxococcales bacterium]MCZ6568636.1 3-deoxy-D-manno-octulosonic acid transferase [Deltaproteobacteria bacterium]